MTLTPISINPDKWIGILPDTDPTLIYTQEYFEKYTDPNYVNPEIRSKRRQLVIDFADLWTSFDYGCGPEPLARGELLGCYDKYCEDFRYFDRDTFYKADTVLLFDVCEHMLDPWAFLFGLPQQRIIMTIPIFPGPLKSPRNLIGWKHFKKTEHIWYFTEKGIEDLIHQTGWKLIYYGSEECPPREDIATIVIERARN